MLILNGTLVECPGLIHGKTGMAIFFFHYARHTGNGLFEDYAVDLIEIAQQQIHANSPAGYERGIAGIGVGVDYLIRNNFLEADEDIFDDFDQRIYRATIYDPWLDFGLYNGLTGYGQYWITRLRQQVSSERARECLFHITGRLEEKLTEIPVKEQTDVYCFLQDLHLIPEFHVCTSLLEQCRKWELQSVDGSRRFPRLGNSMVSNIVRMLKNSDYFNCTQLNEIDAALKQIPDWDFKKPPISMGLLNGYAGEGMLRLTTLNPLNKLWMHLL